MLIILFAEFLEFVCHELYFCSYDNLYGILARTDHACNTCRFDLLLVNLCVILNLKTKSCDAVIDGCNVPFAANAFEDDRSNLCEVVVCENYALLCICIIVISRPGVFRSNFTIAKRNTT